MTWADLTPIAGLLLALAGVGAQLDAWRQRRQKHASGDRKAALDELGFVIDQLREEIVRTSHRADVLETLLNDCQHAKRLLERGDGG